MSQNKSDSAHELPRLNRRSLLAGAGAALGAIMEEAYAVGERIGCRILRNGELPLPRLQVEPAIWQCDLEAF